MATEKERMTLYIPRELRELLRDYAYCMGSRTPNEAAVSIIYQRLDEWRSESTERHPTQIA